MTLRERFTAIRCEPMQGNADSLATQIARDRESWTRIVSQIGSQLQ